jgi:3-methyladenine DNA glycosylase AlkD
MAQLHRLSRELPRSHDLARGLWDLGLHETRLLATLVEDPAAAGDEQLDRWVSGADHHDLSDRIARRVARGSVFARTKVADWKEHPRELVRRSAYMLLGDLAATDRAMTDADFIPHVDVISTTIHLEPPLVREAMIRALVRIGRRNGPLRRRALDTLHRCGGLAPGHGALSLVASGRALVDAPRRGAQRHRATRTSAARAANAPHR